MRDIRGGRIAYIPQEPMSNLDPSFTVGSQLTEPMQIKLGVSRSEAKARALELLGQSHPRPRADLRLLPARAVRRHGAARPDRRRRILRPTAHHRR